MIALAPPVQVQQGDITYVAYEAGRDRGGLRASVRANNGTVLHAGNVVLGDDKSRARFAKNLPMVDPAKVDAALLDLQLSVETVFRQREDERTRTSSERREAATAMLDGTPYYVHENRIYYRQRTRDGEVSIPLCNFTAAITQEVHTDDGATERGELIIVGTLADGAALSPVRVPLSQFAGMSWPTTSWGTRAVVAAGMGAKDRLREAVQLLSPDVQHRREYAHSGWRRIDGNWDYLTADAVIGGQGAVDAITVRLSGALTRLSLPAPPAAGERIAAVRASLAILDIAPDRITASVLGATYRAPLNEARVADMGVHLSGPTGAQKSEIVALAQQHYGAAFDRLHLPGSWISTPNALERLLFEGKDALIGVDDFAPHGSQQDINRLHGTADRVIRGVGNGAGRSRMSADGRLRPDYPPRGFILSTGEDVPRGQSLQARLALIEIARGEVDLAALTHAQKDGSDGIYAQAMAGYVQWLATKMDDLKETARDDLSRLRDAARSHGAAHARTPDVVAHLAYGWECWLRYALECGAITEQERIGMWQRVWEALGAMAAVQGEHQRAEEPTRRFLDLVATAIASQQAHLRHPNSGVPSDPKAWGWRPRIVGGGEFQHTEWNPCGPCVGWIEDDDLYLEPDTAFQLANRIASANGSPLAIAPRTLSKRLHERGLLLATDTGGHTVRRMIEGRKHRVLHLPIGVLSAENPSDPSPSPTSPLGARENGGTDSENNPSPTRPETREPVLDPSSNAGMGRIGGWVHPSANANPSSTKPCQAREKTDRTDRTAFPEVYTPLDASEAPHTFAVESDPAEAVRTMQQWIAAGALDLLPDVLPLPDDLADYRERSRLTGLCRTYLDYLPGSLTARDAIVRLVDILTPFVGQGGA